MADGGVARALIVSQWAVGPRGIWAEVGGVSYRFENKRNRGVLGVATRVCFKSCEWVQQWILSRGQDDEK